MSRAWYMDSSESDQRLEHHMEPPQYLPVEELKEKTGVTAIKLNPSTMATDGQLDAIKKERGYNYDDLIEVSKEKLPGYEDKIKSFFTEHIHTDEEIRLIEGGSGYFDVRDKNDRWVRIESLPGDLIILPAGIYHRFTVDSKDYIKARRLFIGAPVWTPHNRPAEEFKERQAYVKWMETGFTGEPDIVA